METFYFINTIKRIYATSFRPFLMWFCENYICARINLIIMCEMGGFLWLKYTI